MMKLIALWISLVFGIGLIIGTWQHRLPLSWSETLGFVTGAACVYLVVEENIWNFPLGIANNIFFLILFLNARLYGDAGLQIVYLVLGVQGWYWWLYGSKARTALQITRASPRLLALTAAFALIGTAGMMVTLRAAKGSAPLLDALTTMLSLAAQYLLNRKLIENWLLWIVADIVYIYLYYSRGLKLTAVLYFIFLCLCLTGWLNWRRLSDARIGLKPGELTDQPIPEH